MQSRRTAAAIAVIGVIAAVVLFVLRDDEGGESPVAATTETTTPSDEGDGGGEKPEPPPEPEPATIVVKNGQPVGGLQELEFDKGGRIRFVVESDVDEEVHLHGYDVSEDVSAGGKVEFDLPATIEGVFEVELEESVVPLAEVTVNLLTEALDGILVVGHALVGRQDLPIPEWLFAWGASLILIVSSVALSVAWQRTRLEQEDWRAVAPWLSRLLVNRVTSILAGIAGVALLGVVVWSGLTGTEAPDRNFSVTFVFVTVWLGMVAISVVFGDLFRAFNPWRAIAAPSARSSNWSRASRRHRRCATRIGSGAGPRSPASSPSSGSS